MRSLRVGGLSGRGTIRASAERSLPPGCLVLSQTSPQVGAEPAFTRALAEVVGPRPPRAARLVLPDRAARLHVLLGDAVPAGSADLHQFVAWRLRDLVPFAMRDARVACLAAPNGQPGQQVALALVTRDAVLAQFERLLAALGIRVVHVASATCHLFNLASRDLDPADEAVHALLTLGPDAATVVVVQHGIPHYVRTFLRPGHDAPLPEVAPPAYQEPPRWHKELAEELLRSFAHAGDTAGLGPPRRLCLAGELTPLPRLASALEEILDIPCAPLEPPSHRPPSGTPLPPEAHALLAAALARC